MPLEVRRPDISRMMQENFFPQGRSVDMGIDLSGADVFMAQHGLYGPKVGPAFQESRGERMAQRMGRDGLMDAGITGSALDHDKNHGAREMVPPTVEKYIVFLARLYRQVYTVGKPELKLPDGFL